jgi:hypothetical protein
MVFPSHVLQIQVAQKYIDGSAGQRTLDKVESVLAPEKFAIDPVTGRTKHPGINGRLGARAL